MTYYPPPGVGRDQKKELPDRTLLNLSLEKYCILGNSGNVKDKIRLHDNSTI